jgi:hypothetical protein
MYWIDHIAEDRFSVWFGPDWVQDFNDFENALDFVTKMREDG